MQKTPKEESEEILNFLLYVVEELLQKYEELYPFAAFMDMDNKIQKYLNFDYGSNDHPESNKVIEDIEREFINGANNNKYKATGLVYMVYVTNPETHKKMDAICVNLDHVNNYSVKLIYLYDIKKEFFGKKKLYLYEPTVSKGDGKIFKK